MQRYCHDHALSSGPHDQAGFVVTAHCFDI
jgi:hypothetical protein